ncbi:1-acyl-sn-glycerol-3-phosphate acyltransferase [Brachybacterium sp. YJGR34]|uniref:lysophospholipid acyltransferase family protein n=1 Tax=Brachybacterium sp. YJGR34 TaxID=2059911 RepID=UPI000E0A5E61|nr:lysophospholipid acyltransferase family protein [Brachybacterium sp. YJGR34]
MKGVLRSWDVGRARPAPRRAGAVIDLAQIPLRPLLSLLARPRWQGVENLPATGPAIACGNHLSAFDPLGYGHLLQASGIAPRFLAKESLFRVPVLGTLLRQSRQIPVRRGTSRSGDALGDARAALGRGELLMIFPEGTYTRDRHLWPMQGRYGAARLALETGAPLVPIASWGSRALWPVGSPVPHPGPGRRVQMLVGEPFTVSRREGETSQQAVRRVTEELMARIAELLGRLRGETPPAVLHDGSMDAHRPEIGRTQPGYRAWKQES